MEWNTFFLRTDYSNAMPTISSSIPGYKILCNSVYLWLIEINQNLCSKE